MTSSASLASSWLRLREGWSRLDPARRLMVIGLASRLFVIGVAIAAGALLPPIGEGGWNRGPGFVRYFARWDSGFYMDIAELGYGFKPEAWAFNPGYPLLIALVRVALPFLDPALVGFLVSNAAFFVALWLFHDLTRRLFDEKMAFRAGVFFAIFPGSFYFSAVYADAVFLAMVVGAFLAMHEQRWLVAGFLTSLAAITRPPGLVLVGALGLALLVALARDRRLPLQGWASGAAAGLLPGVFTLYAWRATGDPWVSARMREVYWPNVQWHNPLNLFDLGGVTDDVRALIYLSMGLLVAALVFAALDLALRRRSATLPVYAFSAVMGAIYLGYSEPNPIVRYLLPILPVFWLLAWASRWRWAFAALSLACLALLAFVTQMFARWGPLY